MSRPSAAATRDRFLRAAAEEILVEGYAGATLSSISARLGMTKGSLSYHFPSKIDVAHALFAHMDDTYTQLRVGVRADGLRGIRALIVLVSRVRQRTRTDTPFAAANSLVVTPGILRSEAPALFDDLIETNSCYLREAIEDGEIPDDIDVVEAAEDVLAATIGWMVLFSRHTSRESARPLRVTRRILAGLGVTDIDALVDDLAALDAAS